MRRPRRCRAIPQPNAHAPAVWPYLAGLLDADGCISVNARTDSRTGRRRYTTRVFVSNADKGLMNWLVAEFDGNINISNRNAPPNHRTMYRWVVHGIQAGPILFSVLPYLRIKAQQAELVLRFIHTLNVPLADRAAGVGRARKLPKDTIKLREHIVLQLKRMNRRGRPR